jgi:hypothetical protein
VFGTFATGGCDGYVNIWDGAAKKRLFVLPKFPSSVAALSFNHDGSLLVRAQRCAALWLHAAAWRGSLPLTRHSTPPQPRCPAGCGVVLHL